jgi:hypothetical protein
MTDKKTILVINGSASVRSSNERLIERLKGVMEAKGRGAFEIMVWNGAWRRPSLRTSRLE